MAANTGKSQFAAKMGNNAAIMQSIVGHANDETPSGVISLPAGIKNGIAQLVDCYFAEFKSGKYKGEYYWYASASIISPEVTNTADGPMKIRGLHTRQTIQFCDAKNDKGVVTKPQDEFIRQIMLHMRRLGADTTTCTTPDDLNNICAMLKDEKPVFRFTTTVRKGQMWNGKQQPDGVWENWNGVEGVVLSDIPNAQVTEVNDATGNPSSNGTVSHSNPWSESMDFDALLAAVSVDKPDINACTRIKELGVAVGGMSDEDVERDDVTWEDIINNVKSAMTPEWKCEKGATGYMLIYNKSSKKTDQGVSVQIITDPANGKVKVNDTATGKELVNPVTGKPMGLVDVAKIQADPF